MDPSEQCPEPGTWKTFLDEASADLTAHLEACEACQQTLERLAAGKETWEGTAKHLAAADANADQLGSSEHRCHVQPLDSSLFEFSRHNEIANTILGTALFDRMSGIRSTFDQQPHRHQAMLINRPFAALL